MIRRIIAVLIAAAALAGLNVAHAAAESDPLITTKGQVHQHHKDFRDRSLTGGEVYGWSWNHPVTVYDGTFSQFWDTAEVIRQWDRATPLSITQTSDPATADIVINEVDVVYCGSTTGSVTTGCAYQEPEYMGFVDNHPTLQCRIELPTFVGANYLAAEMMALHEVGHCLGLMHVYQPLTKNGNPASVMVTPMDSNNYLTRPTSYDKANLALLYG